MKELSIEEKAKRYDEAIERAKDYYHLGDDKHKMAIDAKAVMEYIFPELKESENGRMVQYFKDLAPFDKADELYEKYGFSHKDAIAWLEKQGRHAKFINGIQVGDKVTRNEDGVLVNLSQLNRVAKKDEKQGKQKPADKIKPKFKVGDKIVSAFNTPYYITKVCDRYYLTDVGRIIMFNAQDNFELAEQNPAWSEEDEKILKEIITDVRFEGYNNDLQANSYRKIRWLKSLKDRYTWKPSDEQMNALNDVISSRDIKYDILSELWKDLKKLKGLSYESKQNTTVSM